MYRRLDWTNTTPRHVGIHAHYYNAGVNKRILKILIYLDFFVPKGGFVLKNGNILRFFENYLCVLEIFCTFAEIFNIWDNIFL